MKLVKPFLLSLLLNISFIGLINFFFNTKKQTQIPSPSIKDQPFKMKLHLKDALQMGKAKKTFNKKTLLDKPQKPSHKREKKIGKKRQKDAQKSQVEKKLEEKTETKSKKIFKPSIISKLKGLIKGKIPYPYAAIVKNMEGKVHYTLTLTPKGQTFRYKMTKSSGHSLLDKTVKDFFLRNPLEGQIVFNDHKNKPLVISDHIQFKIEGL